ncbi:MAG TPA: hypothetical protein VJX71_17920 [Methylomirabilota bacterium]|nr:hypothetical protein [Methylomirabilota bacterium]
MAKLTHEPEAGVFSGAPKHCHGLDRPRGERAFPLDQLITNVMTYWLTRCANL